jgi:multidrug efflux pump subunit AcrB
VRAFEWTDLAFQQQQRGTPTILVFGAAALFVFLVLVAQYESWKLPLAIVLFEPVRHRQTKGAATDMFGLQPPRHTPTLPLADPLLP